LKTIDILKLDGHLLFGVQEIWKAIRGEEIEVAYERLMSPLDNMFKMSLFFVVVQIRVIEAMVCEDIGSSKKFGSK
jgi:hypothetical protein